MLVVSGEEKILNEIIKKTESVTIVVDGKKKEIKKGNENFNKIIDNVLSCFEGARIMPALGVSLHNLTVEEMKQNKWIKLNFNKTVTLNELPFDSLLFRLDECYGINLIRQTNGKYEGRCIYLDLDGKTDLSKIID